MQQAASRSFDREKEDLAQLVRGLQTSPTLGDCGQIIVEGPVHVSSHARLYLGRLPHRAAKFLIKCYFVSGTNAPDTAEAQYQYDSLVHLNQTRVAISGFNLVEPFHLFRDQGVVLQSWIEGRSLDKTFADTTYSARRLENLVGDAGAWLAHFHRSGSDGQRATISATLFDEVEEDAGRLGRRGRKLIRAARVMRRSSVVSRGTKQPVALLHCDFKPANVIATSGNICAIDFQSSKRASVYFDIAHFLNSMAIDVLKARRLDLILQASSMHRGFVAAYERIGEPVDRIVLAYVLTYDLGRYMLQHGAGASSLGGTVKWWTMERLLARRVAQFRSLESRHTQAL